MAMCGICSVNIIYINFSEVTMARGGGCGCGVDKIGRYDFFSDVVGVHRSVNESRYRATEVSMVTKLGS